MYLVFTPMPGGSYRRRLPSLLCLCDISANSLPCVLILHKCSGPPFSDGFNPTICFTPTLSLPSHLCSSWDAALRWSVALLRTPSPVQWWRCCMLAGHSWSPDLHGPASVVPGCWTRASHANGWCLQHASKTRHPLGRSCIRGLCSIGRERGGYTIPC